MLQPGETRELSFSYHLPASVIRNGRYRLTARKQAGKRAVPLTVRITGADGSAPGMIAADGLQPTRVDADGALYETDLRVDRRLAVEFSWD
jgi:hypothetical protein